MVMDMQRGNLVHELHHVASQFKKTKTKKPKKKTDTRKSFRE